MCGAAIVALMACTGFPLAGVVGMVVMCDASHQNQQLPPLK